MIPPLSASVKWVIVKVDDDGSFEIGSIILAFVLAAITPRVAWAVIPTNPVIFHRGVPLVTLQVKVC